MHYLLCKTHAFHAQTDYMIFQRILALDYTFPLPLNYPTAEAFIKAVLILDPVGRPDLGSLKQMQVFDWVQDGSENAGWDKLHTREAPAVEIDKTNGTVEDEGDGSDVEFEFARQLENEDGVDQFS